MDSARQTLTGIRQSRLARSSHERENGGRPHRRCRSDRAHPRRAPYPPLRVRMGRVPVWQARMHKRVLATDAVPYPTVIMHPQRLTEAVLRERLAELGGKVEQGTALTGFEQDAHGVTARLGTPLRPRLSGRGRRPRAPADGRTSARWPASAGRRDAGTPYGGEPHTLVTTR